MKNLLLLTASIVAINAAVPHLARISLHSLSNPRRRSSRLLPRSVTGPVTIRALTAAGA